MESVKQYHLAKKLIELRADKTLYSVAKGAGVSRGTLYRYEQGVLVPEDPTLEKLADFYDVPFGLLKKLMFSDLFPKDSLQRQLLLEWVSELSQSQDIGSSG